MQPSGDLISACSPGAGTRVQRCGALLSWRAVVALRLGEPVVAWAEGGGPALAARADRNLRGRAGFYRRSAGRLRRQVHPRRIRFPDFSNADHTHSLAKAEEAARAGYDMIGFDGSTLPFEENVRQTKEAVEAIKSINADIVVEGELGYIGSGSEIHDTIPESSLIFTRPDEARQFAEAAGVDVLAPAVGNMHGLRTTMVRGEAGMTIVHISTELRLAWRRGLEAALASEPDGAAVWRRITAAVAQLANTTGENGLAAGGSEIRTVGPP